MLDSRSEVVDSIRKRLGRGLKILRVEDGLIFEHRNANHFLAEVDMKGLRITVPVTAEFVDHPEYDEAELVEQAMEVVRPELECYRERGYQLREMEWHPGYLSPSYNENKVPVFIAYVERTLEDWEELFVELPWLLEQLPMR